MASSSKVPIILLKNKSTPSDNYEDLFLKEGYNPAFVPVLDHVFAKKGLASVKSAILDDCFSNQRKACEKSYGGLIFTSQRAVEAFSYVVQELRHDGVNVEGLFASDFPVYVVGPATANSLRKLDLPFLVIGEHTGYGDVLAEFILENYNQLHKDYAESEQNEQENAIARKPGLLFLVGEQRRDIIPLTLQAETLPEDRRITVNEITVYETAVKETFTADFGSELKLSVENDSLLWIVVFSPTGCKSMLDGLGLLDQNSGKVKEETKISKRKTFIATIGPTTQRFLVREFDFEPDVCSSAPSPEGLLQSIATFESQHTDLLAR